MALIRPTSFWRQVSPRGAIADLVTVFREAGPNRWRIAALSALATGGVFSLMWGETYYGPPARPEITYITTWAPHRTEAEILASNVENQRRKERLAAEQAKRDEEIRKIYKDLGRATGLDVDRMERQILAERAAEEAAAKKAVPTGE